MWLNYQRISDRAAARWVVLTARVSICLAGASFLLVVADYAYSRGRSVSDYLEWLETLTAWGGAILGAVSIYIGRRAFPVWVEGAIALLLSALSLLLEGSMSRIIVTSG